MYSLKKTRKSYNAGFKKQALLHRGKHGNRAAARPSRAKAKTCKLTGVEIGNKFELRASISYFCL